LAFRTRIPWLAAVAAFLCASPALAQTEDQDEDDTAAILLPVLTPELNGLRVPNPRRDKTLFRRAREVNATLTDAAQDLGLSMELSHEHNWIAQHVSEEELIQQAHAKKAWVFSPRLEQVGSKLRLRIIAVPPDSKVVMVRVELVTRKELPVKVVVMLRDLVHTHRPGKNKDITGIGRLTKEPTVKQARSEGRAVLALSTAAFGGFIGYSLQKASRGDDPRLLYPLMALGTGVGLGASMIIADEWDVGVGDAWYLTAGMLWPTASALLLSSGYKVEPSGDGFAFGLIAGIGGAGLASVALSQHGIGEGAAVFTHSGAAFGMFVGGFTEILVRGTTEETPYKGLGFGTGIGVIGAGLIATQLQISPSRVLLTDLGASLGTLAGAAAASPLLFDNVTPTKRRAWTITTMAGTLTGAGIALWLTKPSPPSHSQKAQIQLGVPTPGVINVMNTGQPAVWGVNWGGAF
jgi:hypothetical protein